MSNLQKKLIKKTIVTIFIIIAGILLVYAMLTNTFVLDLVIIIVASAIGIGFFGLLIYGFVKCYIDDYKLRGVLTEEEYKLFNLYSDRWYIRDKRENEIYEEILEKLRQNGLKY